MTKDDPPIDPRYDPVYQRGFAGAAPARIRAVETPKQERPQPQQRPEAHRAAVRPSSEERIDPFVVPPAESAQDEFLPDPSVPQRREEPPASPGVILRGNPWIATLWVVGVLLVTGGFYGAVRSQLIYVGATPIDDGMNEIVTMEVLDLLSPPLILAGLLVIAGVLFLHAIAWRARRRVDDEDEDA
ncbi:MAG: hypothetical protein M3116_06670 [Actinomycetota bacterium]|nr:hypothetical protein [Actinomycetota bacterium]